MDKKVMKVCKRTSNDFSIKAIRVENSIIRLEVEFNNVFPPHFGKLRRIFSNENEKRTYTLYINDYLKREINCVHSSYNEIVERLKSIKQSDDENLYVIKPCYLTDSYGQEFFSDAYEICLSNEYYKENTIVI